MAETAPVFALTAEAVTAGYGRSMVLDHASVAIPQGRITAILGANGSGKSTLLRSLARLLPLQGGVVRLNGRDIAELPTREVARRMAVLPQSAETPPGLCVRELVEFGRYPHRGPLGRLGTDDADAVEWAMAATGLTAFAERPVAALSGGERQRAWIAMALAQRGDVLLLDEPTTFLDVRHQLEVLCLVRNLNREHGITVAWVLHDLNQAAAYSDHVVLMHRGRVCRVGAPRQVLTAETIEAVFGVTVSVISHPVTGAHLCLPLDLLAAS
jgi:iron-chelate-transporting ATPase